MYQRNSRPVRLIQLEQAVSDHPELFVHLMEAWIVGVIGFKPETTTDLSQDPIFAFRPVPSALDTQLGDLSAEEFQFLVGSELLAESSHRTTVFDGAPVERDVKWRDLLQEVA